ncbi:MAG: hypothetical protein K940chlam5_01119, partial [Candidatus Anoxychlamydiales bacterium]|nr:hypothetical protein [Candidatus Anoxychlamydiales bacterium]
VFTVKAVSYPSTTIAVENYIDSEDFAGPMEEIFRGALSFITRNLRKIQAGQSINSLGKMEISKVVFEELLVNALIHRDYFVNAPIRIFCFTDRIEIISPGHLPNNLTIEKIKAGNSNIRNPILASFISKGLLPYRGLGSGIKRALEAWPDIDFIEDREGCLFTVKVHRKSSSQTVKSSPQTVKNSPDLEKSSSQTVKSSPQTAKNSPDLEKSSQKILALMRDNPEITIDEMSKQIGIGIRGIKKQINNLKNKKLIERFGPNKGGYWRIFSSSTKEQKGKKSDEIYQFQSKSSRQSIESSPQTAKNSPDLEKSSQKILALMRDNPEITIDEMSKQIGIGIRGIKKQINNLKNKKLIERFGPNKGGYWKIFASSTKEKKVEKSDEIYQFQK